MIINKHVYTNTNNRNYKKYIDLGYKFKIGDSILVDIRDLNLGSLSIVDVRCDICGIEKKLKYSMYIKNIKKYNLYTCSGKCSNFKYKKTCLEKFGCEYPLQNVNIKDNLKKFFQEKYGVGHPSILEEFELKKQLTNIDKYGVSHQMKIYNNVNKIKKTKLERHGDENYNNRSKSSKTKLEKYGDENYNNQDKYKKTMIERYGVDNNMKNSLLFIKNQKSRYSINKIGDLYYQSSYELDFIKKIGNIKIENGPSIEYKIGSKNHVYHSDFYLPEHNLICEIKSNYIYNKELEINNIKRENCIKNGYNFIFIIDKDYSELEKITNTNGINSAL